jgi:tRNA G10  N-methylase Trm11
MLGRLKFDIDSLVKKMLDKMPEDTIINGTILDPAIGGGQFVKEVERRKRAAGKTDAEIRATIFGIEENVLRKNYAVNKHKLVGNYTVNNFMVKDFKNMKFDAIVGNPPFQDGTKEGGQNKIYNVICKKALSLLKDDGIMSFITPTSVLKKSKRFSLIDQPGLKSVDFAANNHFEVGIGICCWTVDKNYQSNQVTVTHCDGTTSLQPSSEPIYDYTTVDKDFTVLYNKLKKITDTPDKRMFRENNFGDAIQKSKSGKFTHIIYSINKDSNKEIFGYSKRVPFFHNKKKIVVPMTKTLTDDSILVDTDDFYVAYLCTEIKNQKEVDNIKSFILSDYFKQHSEKWKQLDGYGFNYSLKYLPPFNTSKQWSSDEVKTFIESFK